MHSRNAGKRRKNVSAVIWEQLQVTAFVPKPAPKGGSDGDKVERRGRSSPRRLGECRASSFRATLTSRNNLNLHPVTSCVSITVFHEMKVIFQHFQQSTTTRCRCFRSTVWSTIILVRSRVTGRKSRKISFPSLSEHNAGPSFVVNWSHGRKWEKKCFHYTFATYRYIWKKHTTIANSWCFH